MLQLSISCMALACSCLRMHLASAYEEGEDFGIAQLLATSLTGGNSSGLLALDAPVGPSDRTWFRHHLRAETNWA